MHRRADHEIEATGMEELDGKWFSTYMGEIHGTLGCLAANGGRDVEDLLTLHTAGVTYRMASASAEQKSRRGRTWNWATSGSPAREAHRDARL